MCSGITVYCLIEAVVLDTLGRLSSLILSIPKRVTNIFKAHVLPDCPHGFPINQSSRKNITILIMQIAEARNKRRRKTKQKGETNYPFDPHHTLLCCMFCFFTPCAILPLIPNAQLTVDDCYNKD